MKVAVLLSGGLDSTTALHWAHAQHTVVCAISFDYAGNHARQELACARYQAERLGIPCRVIDISSIAPHLQSALLSGADAIPTDDYDESNMKQTVVPFRNGIFLAIAAGIAESQGAEGIVIAAHSGDHAIYPDCRSEFMSAMGLAISLGTYAKLKIIAPFIDSSKGDIVSLGHSLHVDYAHTYSCYKGNDRHCGRCATCRERRQAFAAAGVDDPTVYEA